MDIQISTGRKTLLSTATTETGSWMNTAKGPSDRTFQGTVAGTGAVSATIVIEVSNDGTNAITLGTITLSGTTSATDGFASQASWAFTRARVSAISGTSAAVTVVIGV